MNTFLTKAILRSGWDDKQLEAKTVTVRIVDGGYVLENPVTFHAVTDLVYLTVKLPAGESIFPGSTVYGNGGDITFDNSTCPICGEGSRGYGKYCGECNNGFEVNSKRVSSDAHHIRKNGLIMLDIPESFYHDPWPMTKL